MTNHVSLADAISNRVLPASSTPAMLDSYGVQGFILAFFFGTSHFRTHLLVCLSNTPRLWRRNFTRSSPRPHTHRDSLDLSQPPPSRVRRPQRHGATSANSKWANTRGRSQPIRATSVTWRQLSEVVRPWRGKWSKEYSTVWYCNNEILHQHARHMGIKMSATLSLTIHQTESAGQTQLLQQHGR